MDFIDKKFIIICILYIVFSSLLFTILVNQLPNFIGKASAEIEKSYKENK